MKKMLLCLAILSLLALPAMASGEIPEGSVGADAQAYVNTVASYQSGSVDQESCEVGIRCVEDVSTSGSISSFDCSAHVPSYDIDSSTHDLCGIYTDTRTIMTQVPSDCGLDLCQFKWDASLTFTKQISLFKESVSGQYAVGSNNMTTAAGAAICASAGTCASAEAGSLQAVCQSAVAPVSTSTTANYFGGQYVNVKVNVQ
jgi:hypothetical protein